MRGRFILTQSSRRYSFRLGLISIFVSKEVGREDGKVDGSGGDILGIVESEETS